MVTRVGGIASGLDTEAIISALIEAQSRPVTSLTSIVEDDEYKLGQWTELDDSLSDLRSMTEQLSSYSTWSQIAATSSDTSKLNATISSSASPETGTYSISVSTLAKAQSGYSNEVTAGKTADIMGSNTASYTINGATINIAANSSLTDIKDAINGQTSNMTSGVKASILGNRLVLENTTTGTGHDMAISYAGGTLDILGESAGGGIGLINSSGALVNETASQNLTGTIGGTPFSSSTNTSSDLIEGVTLNFTATGDSTLTVGRDTSTIKSLISDFIEQYNETMALLKEKGDVNLSSSGGISSLGTLQGDYLLGMIQTNSRSILTSIDKNPNYMNQAYNSLYKVGIWFSSDANELSIVDETKLDDALASNFDDVETLFRGWGNTTSGEGQGVLRRLDNFLYSQTDPINGGITLRKNELDTDINSKNNEISALNLRLLDYESDLWQHFAAMEEAVSAIQDQGSYILSLLN
ncbi:MAG: hypothetical protein A2017_00850 [Lentisphaerae bacterium GWF2_44_16]|nr:MAG: hypothetical protein A2017_00850 [Lentisphaerae bacterium GWF2_44_16]